MKLNYFLFFFIQKENKIANMEAYLEHLNLESNDYHHDTDTNEYRLTLFLIGYKNLYQHTGVKTSDIYDYCQSIQNKDDNKDAGQTKVPQLEISNVEDGPIGLLDNEDSINKAD